MIRLSKDLLSNFVALLKSLVGVLVVLSLEMIFSKFLKNFGNRE